MAIQYGATIIYTSAKTNSNLNILYDYICHILFNFDLIHKPNLVDKEAYYIPAGYDNLDLLKSNDEQKNYLKESYEKKILPINKKNIQEEDIQCEDTNVFFESLKELGVKGKDKGASNSKLGGTNSFIEQKKNNLDMADMKNYETNIPMNRNPLERDKKKADIRKEIKERMSIQDSFNKRDVKGKENKENVDEKKKRLKEEMLAKIRNKRLSKPLDKVMSKK